MHEREDAASVAGFGFAAFCADTNRDGTPDTCSDGSPPDGGAPQDSGTTVPDASASTNRLGTACNGAGQCGATGFCMSNQPGTPLVGFCSFGCQTDQQCASGYAGQGVPRCITPTTGVPFCAVACPTGSSCPSNLLCMQFVSGSLCDVNMLGAPCRTTTDCGYGGNCLSLNSAATYGFCSYRCTSNTLCQTGYFGPGAALCALGTSPTYCAVACGPQYNQSSSCPALTTCQDLDRNGQNDLCSN
jgi:hypothetical protein